MTSKRKPLFDPEFEPRIINHRKAGLTMRAIAELEDVNLHIVQKLLVRNGFHGRLKKSDSDKPEVDQYTNKSLKSSKKNNHISYVIDIPSIQELVKQYGYVGIEPNFQHEFLVTIGDTTGAPSKNFDTALRNAYEFALRGDS